MGRTDPCAPFVTLSITAVSFCPSEMQVGEKRSLAGFLARERTAGLLKHKAGSTADAEEMQQLSGSQRLQLIHYPRRALVARGE